MSKYWEDRYITGGNSGLGSYGEYAKHKADVINNYIKKLNIKTISDFGCGDGNQISLIYGYEKYVGFDVSKHIVSLCDEKFKNIENMSFINTINDLPESDLCLSLDVIYHIIDENEYQEYLKQLFNKSKKYVLIFSSNHENDSIVNHIYHRVFTKWVNDNINNFKFIEEINNNLKTSAKFFLFEKI